MPDFGLVGASYTAPSIFQDDQECINWRPEVDPTNNVIALYPTPGYTNVATLNFAEVRGMRTISGGQQMVVVCGEYVWVFDNNLTPELVGELNTATGIVGITDNGQNVYIVDGDNRYTWRISKPNSANFLGTLVGTTLTVTSMKSGTIAVNQQLLGVGVRQETIITALGTGTGGEGTYTVNLTQSPAAIEFNTANTGCTFTGSILNNVLSVSAVQSGTLYVGQTIQGAGVTAGTIITALGENTVLSAVIKNPGTGYNVNDILTVQGGTSSAKATYEILTTTTGAGGLGTLTGGSAYTNGTYNDVQLQYVSGATATTYPKANILVQGGVVTGVVLTTVGSGFNNTGTVLTANASDIGGTGSGFQVPVTTLATGAIATINQTSGGQYTLQPNNPVSTTTSGSGKGATLTLTFGTGTDGTGSYLINNTQTVTSEQMWAINYSILPTTDGAFEGGTSVDTIDNYFVYNRPNTQQWASTDILSPISQPLAFSSKDGAPDNLVSLIVDHREVYLLGEASSEVWVDSGLFPFAFQRIPGTSTQHGIVAPYSVARLGNSFAYLSKNTRGQSQVVMMNGYTPTRISTHAVENTLANKYVEDARAYTYQLEGHEIYVLTFPKLDLTWAFDTTTQMWHKWLSSDQNGQYHRHRSNCFANFQNQLLIGDYQNGQIYALSNDVYTENGETIRRLRRAPHLVSNYQRQYFDELQIYFEAGVGQGGVSIEQPQNYVGSTYFIQAGDTFSIGGFETIFLGEPLTTSGTEITLNNPQAMLRYSDDAGSTWSNENWVQIGQQGQYKNRAIWRRLGWARDRVFEVVVTDPIKAVIVAANLKANQGDN
jgi:hypothetical protein